MSPNSHAPDALVERHARAGRSLVAILHAIQDDAGYVPPGCVAPLARVLNLSRAEVHGVLTYYHHFRTAPPARVTIQMCRAEACRSMGCETLAAHAEARTGCRFDAAHGDAAQTHAPDAVALESVYCLGLCAQSPSMTVNGVLHAKVTPEKFDALLADAVAHTPEAA
ncbi:formate dehydrogenase [Burkholderia stabilis]|uniref:NAD(P)H-dependent oxidoreductase subunit E n=1 Tax=Burkholderia stabilis TaxID=95485 RepID=UPI0008517742|nr:NAD(P)H-dependent oxidoreductase subunit E [Burkholderia stabilis]AOR67314.1 formate dehydrogenase [Burkholderia stabilis]HDR9493569.1 NAD(P)H-dependent oxidoreductase subunit E [Burkholderia stabilis]HDR9523886.1 NAD(P)H-dependent oxidoreductase subunit E [Burkholderia stabilis]HDR9529675.1 NAD(P)H-dependent oxidoreductase subunit E [Burkholderia stabilis]HDR9540888.1 NAD(P)H-dependent oxidoreductase subunit E [Burkholderia stabilis]